MAENNNMVSTSIMTHTKFGTEPSKHAKFAVSLFQKTMGFAIYRGDGTGKFNNKAACSVYFSSLAYNENVVLAICEDMLKRITQMHKGENLKSEPIIIHNGKKGYPSATSSVEFTAFNQKKDGTTMETPMVVIKLKKRPENAKEWSTDEAYYLSDGCIGDIYVAGDKLKYKESYMFFDQLRHILQGFVDRTSPKRDLHWQQVLKAEGGNNNNNNTSSKPTHPSSATEVDMDDDYGF